MWGSKNKPTHPEFEGYDAVRIQVESVPSGQAIQDSETVIATIEGPTAAVLSMIDKLVAHPDSMVLGGEYLDSAGNRNAIPGFGFVPEDFND